MVRRRLRAESIWHRRVAVGAAAATAVLLIGLTGSALADGSGYDQSFSRSASGADPDVSLVRLATTYSGGSNLSCEFSVAGTVVLSDPDYGYTVYFDGNSTATSASYASFSGNVTTGAIVKVLSYATGYFTVSYPLAFALANGSSTLSFSVALSFVGAAANFSVLAEAFHANASGEQYSQLGGTSESSSGSSAWSLVELVVIPIVAAVVVLAVLVLVLRRRRRPPSHADIL